MTLNGVMAVILRYFTEFVYDVVLKELPRFLQRAAILALQALY